MCFLCDSNANHYGELPTDLFVSFQACLGCWCRDVLRILQGKIVAWLSSAIFSEHWGLGTSDTIAINRLVSVCKLIWAPLHCVPVRFFCVWTDFLSWKCFLASDNNLFCKALSHRRLESADYMLWRQALLFSKSSLECQIVKRTLEMQVVRHVRLFFSF